MIVKSEYKLAYIDQGVIKTIIVPYAEYIDVCGVVILLNLN